MSFSAPRDEGDTDGKPTNWRKLFRYFDPRVDLHAADLGELWIPEDVPLRMQRTGLGVFDWVVLGQGVECAVVASISYGEVDALFRGYTRQPSLSFEPDRFAKPVPESDPGEMAEIGDASRNFVAGGLGAYAVARPGPLFQGQGPNGWQVQTKHEDLSVFVADGWGVADEAVAYLEIFSCTRDGNGGVAWGDIDLKSTIAPYWGAGAVGVACSRNAGGRIGHLIYDGEDPPNLVNTGVNGQVTDSPIGRRRVDRGEVLACIVGRSMVDGYTVIQLDGNETKQDAVTGDLTHSNCPMLLGGASLNGVRKCYGDNQWYAFLRFTGEAAENVLAYRAEILAAIQSQLNGARQHTQVVEEDRGWLTQTTDANGDPRELNKLFVPNFDSKVTLAQYRTQVNFTGACGVEVNLKVGKAIDFAAPQPVVSVDAAGNRLQVTAHGYSAGDGPLLVESTGTVPGGLAVNTAYWVESVPDADHIKLKSSPNGAALDITSAGTGSITVIDMQLELADSRNYASDGISDTIRLFAEIDRDSYAIVEAKTNYGTVLWGDLITRERVRQ